MGLTWIMDTHGVCSPNSNNIIVHFTTWPFTQLMQKTLAIKYFVYKKCKTTRFCCAVTTDRQCILLEIAMDTQLEAQTLYSTTESKKLYCKCHPSQSPPILCLQTNAAWIFLIPCPGLQKPSAAYMHYKLQAVNGFLCNNNGAQCNYAININAKTVSNCYSNVWCVNDA